MSGYQEIADALEAVSRRQREYEEEGRRFGQRLAESLTKYLEAPAGAVRVLPPGGCKEGTAYSVLGALSLEDDGFFHIIFRIELGHSHVDVPTRFRKKDGPAGVAWDVALGEGTATRTVDPRMEGHFAEIVAGLVELAKESMGSALERFVRGGGSRQPIGFARWGSR